MGCIQKVKIHLFTFGYNSYVTLQAAQFLAYESFVRGITDNIAVIVWKLV